MAEQELMVRVRDNDPRRCQGDSVGGQCQFARIPGSDYCRIHAGVGRLKTADLAAQRSYKLTQWKSRVSDFASSPSVKSLREEIGIARMSLENILNSCSTAYDIQINSNRISQMLERIEKLVIACDKIETRMMYTLDKSAAILLAQEMIEAIAEEIQDSDLLERISDRIGDTLINAGTRRQVFNGE